MRQWVKPRPQPAHKNDLAHQKRQAQQQADLGQPACLQPACRRPTPDQEQGRDQQNTHQVANPPAQQVLEEISLDRPAKNQRCGDPHERSNQAGYATGQDDQGPKVLQ